MCIKPEFYPFIKINATNRPPSYKPVALALKTEDSGQKALLYSIYAQAHSNLICFALGPCLSSPLASNKNPFGSICVHVWL